MGTAADHGTGHGTGHGIDAVAGYRADRVTVLDHPVAADWLRVLRDRHSDRETFARATAQLTTLVAYEATRDLTLADTCVDTPVLLAAHAHKLVDRLLVVPILRAGLGMADAVCALLPTSAVAHVGLRRDEEDVEAVVQDGEEGDVHGDRRAWILARVVAGQEGLLVRVGSQNGVGDRYAAVQLNLANAARGLI